MPKETVLTKKLHYFLITVIFILKLFHYQFFKLKQNKIQKNKLKIFKILSNFFGHSP